MRLFSPLYKWRNWSPRQRINRSKISIAIQDKILKPNLSSVQFSHSVVSNSLRPHELQNARLPCPSPTPGVHPKPCPSSRWCHQPSHSLSSPSPPAPNPSQQQGLFQWVSSSHEVAKVLELQLQHQSFWWIFWVDFLAVQRTLKKKKNNNNRIQIIRAFTSGNLRIKWDNAYKGMQHSPQLNKYCPLS